MVYIYILYNLSQKKFLDRLYSQGFLILAYLRKPYYLLRFHYILIAGEAHSPHGITNDRYK